MMYIVVVVFAGILVRSFLPVEQTEIPNASVGSPMGQTPAQMDQVEEERKSKETKRVAQTAAREAAQKLAPENPPRWWHAEKVIFQTGSVWVILKDEEANRGQKAMVGLVIHKSHRHYADWLGFASTAASQDDRLTTRLFYAGLADAAHPDSPAAYLSPFSSSE